MADEVIAPAPTASKKSRNVLVAVDGSDYSDRALKFYLSNLAVKGDNVVVLHAQEIPSLPAAPYPYGLAYQEQYSEVVKKANEQGKKLLLHYGHIIENKPGILFRLIKEGGRPGETIVRNIKEENASFVVIGSRGQGTVRRAVLGSVSDYVVRHSHVPVCVVTLQPEA